MAIASSVKAEPERSRERRETVGASLRVGKKRHERQQSRGKGAGEKQRSKEVGHAGRKLRLTEESRRPHGAARQKRRIVIRKGVRMGVDEEEIARMWGLPK